MRLSKLNRPFGLTLIELIILVAVGGLLIAIIFPFSFNRRAPPNIARALMEMSNIEMAIKTYKSTYGRWPVTARIGANVMNDFTFGTFATETSVLITNGGGVEANNAEVICIVMDLKSFPNGTPIPNHDGSMNPNSMTFLNAKCVEGISTPGVGSDGVYRDPWGNPYIITIDSDSSGSSRDVLYSRPSVACLSVTESNRFQLVRHTNSAGSAVYETKTEVMIWSLGPDGKASPVSKANQGVNKDNVLSWP